MLVHRGNIPRVDFNRDQQKRVHTSRMGHKRSSGGVLRHVRSASARRHRRGGTGRARVEASQAARSGRDLPEAAMTGFCRSGRDRPLGTGSAYTSGFGILRLRVARKPPISAARTQEAVSPPGRDRPSGVGFPYTSAARRNARRFGITSMFSGTSVTVNRREPGRSCFDLTAAITHLRHERDAKSRALWKQIPSIWILYKYFSGSFLAYGFRTGI